MYNGQKIKELLRLRNLKQKDLLEALGTRENGSISRFVDGNIKASRLEEIADFFGVSIDTFFIREHGYAAEPGGNDETDIGIGPAISGRNMAKQKERTRLLEMQLKAEQSEKKLLEERIKDKETIIIQMQSRIEMLEEMLNLERTNRAKQLVQISDKINEI